MKPGRTLLRTAGFSAAILVTIASAYAYVILSKGWRIELAKPWMLLCLLLAALAFVAGWVVYGKRDAGPGASAPRLLVSRGADLAKLPRGWKTRVAELPAALRVCAIALVGVALSRPQRVDAPETLELSGIDIVLGGHDHFYHTEVLNGVALIKSGMDFRYATKVSLSLFTDR